jgi:ankyrin repeat protein
MKHDSDLGLKELADKYRGQLQDKMSKPQGSFDQAEDEVGKPSLKTTSSPVLKKPKRYTVIEAAKENAFHEANITFQSRDALIDHLNHFIKDHSQVKAWAISGPSGSGKTRLSREWMLHSPDMQNPDWEQLVLGINDPKNDHKPQSWENWQPEFNTLIVIDYLYVFHEAFKTILNRVLLLEEQGSLQYNIRILLIDHIFPENLEDLHTDSRLALNKFDIEKCRSLFFNNAKPLNLYNIEDRKTLIPAILNHIAGEDFDDQDIITKAANHLESLDNKNTWQPLFAIILAHAIKDAKESDTDYGMQNWNRQGLIAYYLNKHYRNLWEQTASQPEGNIASLFIAVATARRGVDFTLLRKRSNLKSISPQADYNKISELCQNVLSVPTIHKTLPPFEPDILGETFFLRFIQQIQYDYNLQDQLEEPFYHLLSCGDVTTKQQDAIEFISFIKRLTRNLANDNQDDDSVKKHWQVLFDFLDPDNFSKDSLMPWAVSGIIIEIMELVQQHKTDDFSKMLERVDVGQFYAASDYKNTLLQHKEICNKSAELAAKYLEQQYKSKDTLPDKVPNELTELLAHYRYNFAINRYSDLYMVCYWNLYSLCKILINSGANVNQKTSDGWTVLMIACYNGNTEVFKLLLDKQDIDVNVQDTCGRTALMTACRYGNTEVVKLLLDKQDIDVNVQNTTYGWTALMIACFCGNTEVFKLLLDKQDIDVNVQNTDGETALMTACRYGNTGVVKLLLDKQDIDVNVQSTGGWTALLSACHHGNTEMVKLLLDKQDIDINVQDTNGWTALMHACRYGNTEVFKLLLDKQDI